MPSHLKDYMQKQSRHNSQVEGYQSNEMDPRLAANKFQMSRDQCISQLTRILDKLANKDDKIRQYSQKGTNDVIRKFQEDYNVLSKQIFKQVELYLRQNKQKIIRDIVDRRNAQMIEIKPIRKNIQRLRNQLSALREGLHKQHQYREYISKVVRKDFDLEMGDINQQIKRLRFPNVNVSISEHHYSAFKNQLPQLIIIDDEIGKLQTIQKSKYIVYNSHIDSNNNLNMHANRDHIKKHNIDQYK